MNTQVQALDFTSFIFAQGEELKTTSLKIAEAFGKRHDNVLRDIDKILTQVSDIFGKLNFEETEYEKANNLGLMSKHRSFNLTKDGFMILVMGFTGAKAFAIKEAYINAFNLMYAKLFPKTTASPFVTSKEKLLLRTAIEKHCAKTKEAHSYYWKRLHHAYHVSTLEDLPTGKVDEMLAFLGLREPKLDEYILVKKRDVINQPPVSTAPQIPDNMMLITENRYRELNDIDKINSDYVEQLYQEGGCLLSKSSRDEIIECSSNFMRIANAFIELAEGMKARAKRIEISL